MSLQLTDCEDLPTLADEYGYGEPILDKIALWTGDITRIKCDAIVNAANKDLKGGGGIDGAIHRAAGHSALKELTAGFPKPLATGAVALTTAANIKHAKYIMHAVGPQINPPFRNPTDLEQKQLRSCYWAALDYLIDKPDYFKTKGPIKTIAFPCISTGIFGYKPDLAAELVVISVFRWLTREEGYKHVDKIILVLWDNKDKACYNNALKAWVPKTISVMKEFGLIIDEPASKKSKESQNDDSDAEGMQSSGEEEEKEEQQSSAENEGRADASVNNNSSEDDEVANEEEEEDQESDVRAEFETEGEGPAVENETEEVDTSDSN